jgi:hypothetical protein
LLEQAIARFKQGGIEGVAVVLATVDARAWLGIDCTFQGSQLLLLARR